MCITPLGVPVVPEVNLMVHKSSKLGTKLSVVGVALASKSFQSSPTLTTGLPA